MDPRLVFLHIPKAAGTSFRGTVRSVYGPERSFWHGLDADPGMCSYLESMFAQKCFIGGHKALNFYPRAAANLYCSLLREPVARAVSLFSYYTRPDSAFDDAAVARRGQQLQRWLTLGIDPSSIVRSIERCEEFRAEINNHQCAYLSRYNRSFEGALRSITEHDFLVADAANLAALVDELGAMFRWPELPEVRSNMTRAGGHDGILDEPGALELIRSLNTEDKRLYDHVVQAHSGLLRSFNPAADWRAALELEPVAAAMELSRAAWAKVRLQAAATLALPAQSRSSVDVLLHNGSRETLDPASGQGICFAYRLLDSAGQAIGHEGLRTPLTAVVPPGAQHRQAVQVQLPQRHYAAVHAISLSLLQVGKFWVSHVSPGHAHTITLSKRRTA